MREKNLLWLIFFKKKAPKKWKKTCSKCCFLVWIFLFMDFERILQSNALFSAVRQCELGFVAPQNLLTEIRSSVLSIRAILKLSWTIFRNGQMKKSDSIDAYMLYAELRRLCCIRRNNFSNSFNQFVRFGTIVNELHVDKLLLCRINKIRLCLTN